MELLKESMIGKMTIKNRVVMAPMTRSRSDNAEALPTDLHVQYYAQRASAGLIISEGIVVSPQGVGYRNLPGLYSENQAQAWKKVTTAVHAKGGRIFAQLWHVGRLSHPDFLDGKLPVAPSAINPDTDVYTPKGKEKTVTPHALSIAEIKRIGLDFQTAGKHAMQAGFDGVEIHSSNGYLFHQFFNNSSNTRTDTYGGSDENKARFLFEVIDGLKEVMPEEKIAARLNPMLNGMNGIAVDGQTGGTFDHIVNRLNGYKIAYLHVSRPWAPPAAPYFIADVIGHYREIYRGFLIANGNYNRESAEQELASGRADAIAFARPYIANPDLVERFRDNLPLSEANPALFYSPGPQGYTDYASAALKTA
jgi:N-ethylmaleimide reductase